MRKNHIKQILIIVTTIILKTHNYLKFKFKKKDTIKYIYFLIIMNIA